jgi:hypothetical protein
MLGQALPTKHQYPVLGIKTPQAIKIGRSNGLPEPEAFDLGGEAARE